MRPAFYDSSEYKKKQADITHLNWEKGIFNHRLKDLVTRFCKNSECERSFQVKPYDQKIFCSHSCSAKVSNPKRTKLKISKTCVSCNGLLKISSRKYCSFKCQNKYQYLNYIADWKQGFESGTRGIQVRILSKYLRRYLLEKYGEKCSVCGWAKKHSKTLVVPLEVNHIDGNAENNLESNLELLCPNCHALTPNFRNLNKGNGRAWRIKYLKDSF